MKPPHPARQTAWQTARNILCVRLDGLGGVLMCTPALRALRAAVPGRRLTLLASPAGAAAAPYIPELDEAIVHAAPWMPDGAAEPGSDARAGLALVDELAARAFDAAVIFTSHTQSALPAALLCQLAGIPLRLAHCRENPYRLLSDWVPDPEPGSSVRHEVQRQLALVAQAGCAPAGLGLSFVPHAADHAAARARLRAAGIDPERPWIWLHPGAGAAARRYPPALWAQAITLLAAATGLPLVLGGSTADIALVEAIRRDCDAPTYSLAGQLQLGELGAAMRLAALAVTGNSGPAHIAAAVGTPLVDLYALTHPQHTPWGVRSRVLFHDVPCRFCYQSNCPEGHHACLAGVAPDRIVDAVLGLLQGHAPVDAVTAASSCAPAWPRSRAVHGGRGGN